MFGKDIEDFFNGRYSWRKLANFVDKIQRTRTSWTAWAMQNDVDQMRALSHAGQLDKGPARKPETYEYGFGEELLAAALAQLQAANAAEGERIRGIVPRTARDVLDQETAIADYEVIMAASQDISDEDYQRFIAGDLHLL